MWILLLGLTFGLVASSWASSLQEVTVRGCSYVGVFHIQGRDRYTLNFDEAQKLCEALGTTLASNENVTAAHVKGFESCRYGWVSSGNITISRHVPNALCAANLTGVISLVPTEPHYDAYCYDKTDLSDKNCTFEIQYVGSDPEFLGSTEDTEGLHHTITTTVVPEDPLIDTTVAVTEATQSIEKTNSTPTSSQGEHDVLGDLLDKTTQPPTTIAESTTKDDDLSTESPEHTEDLGGVTEEQTTIILNHLDSFGGSGMGETTHITTSEPDTGHSEDHDIDTDSYNIHSTATTTEDKPVDPYQSAHPRGRMGPDLALPTEDNSSSGSTTDWLVILLVVVAIIAIILVAALVVTRNRWCGRSQTLMITSKSSSEGNGTAASAASPQAQEREQEMVTLMNKEKIQENGNTEEFTVITLEESPDKNQQA